MFSFVSLASHTPTTPSLLIHHSMKPSLLGYCCTGGVHSKISGSKGRKARKTKVFYFDNTVPHLDKQAVGEALELKGHTVSQFLDKHVSFLITCSKVSDPPPLSAVRHSVRATFAVCCYCSARKNQRMMLPSHIGPSAMLIPFVLVPTLSCLIDIFL
jgi:hypothetical protein